MNAIEVKAAWSLAVLFAFRMLGLFMVLPVFAIYGQDLSGATPALIGLAIGMYGLTQAGFQVPLGYLSDRVGRKPVIVFGLFVFFCGSVVATLADSIWGVIVGRALQGAGAIAAVVMALLADLTRDEQRTKAMAMVGASIGLSFSIALVIGPAIAGVFQLQGLFAVTALLAVCGIAMVIWVVPSPPLRAQTTKSTYKPGSWLSVLTHPQLLRLDFGVLLLHMTMTATFVVMPLWLIQNADLAVEHHWMVYLPVLLVSFLGMVPVMILGEKKHKSKQVLIFAISLLALALFCLAKWHDSLVTIAAGLFVFFFGFNLLEAMLPSLVSKTVDPAFKGTSMGVYSTSQFLGAFLGGVGAGWLVAHYGESSVFLVASVAMLVWLFFAATMKQPPHLQSMTVSLAQLGTQDMESYLVKVASVTGVKEAILAPEEKTVYLKVDKKNLDQEQLQQVNLNVSL